MNGANVADCRGHCVEPVRFPCRPDNRPGLSRIAYRIGRYGDIRAALMRGLDKEQLLAGWTHRGADDAGIALLQGAAVLGDILTFYQELYANEAFLPTARWRESIAGLVQLSGYRLAPGLGGRTTFAFEVRGDKPVVVPKGFPVTAQVTGLELEADFQTAEEIVAVPGLSKFALYRAHYDPAIVTGTSWFSIDTAALAAARVTLAKGDRLMLVADHTALNTARQIAVVADVRERFERTEVRIEGSWTGPALGAQVEAYKLGKSFRHFGHNAPPTVTTPNASGTGVTTDDVDFTVTIQELGVISIGGGPVTAPPYNPRPDSFSFALDQKADDLSPGTLFLATLQVYDLQSAAAPEVFNERAVTAVTSASVTVGAMTGGTTVVQLDRRLGHGAGFFAWTDLRSVNFHAVVGQRFALKAARAPQSGGDVSTLYFFGDAESYKRLDQRPLYLVGGGHADKTLATITPSALTLSGGGPTLRPVTLNPPPPHFTAAQFPDDAPPVSVYGNLVDAAQGKAEREEALGNGDAREVFQTFKLPKAPLTYLNAAGESPPHVPELKVYVNERLWKRVPSLFGLGPKDEVYVVREDPNGDSWVQFGDGKTGSRLPSGVRNVVAAQRSGVGAFGPLKPDTSPNASARLDRLNKVAMPGVAAGGTQPESGEVARAAAPAKVQSLDRLVSLADFEAEALAVAGVRRAAAAWRLVDNVPAVVITVLMETGRADEAAAVETIMAGYNRCRGPRRFPVMIHLGRLKYLYLDATFAADPSLKEAAVILAVKQALGAAGVDGAGAGLFGVYTRSFGGREYATRIEATIQNVPGVVWAKATALGVVGAADDPATLAAPAPPRALVPVVECAADEILALHAKHLDLKAAATPAAAC